MSEPLDIRHLRELFEDDMGSLLQLVNEAVDRSRILIEQIDRFAAERSSESIGAAHELRGLLKTIGAQELASLSDDLEDLARSERWSDVLHRSAQLHDAHKRFEAAAAGLANPRSD